MPIIGADAAPIWTEPNTLDNLPMEATSKPDSTQGIVAIDTKLKANDFPEYIMPEKQGGDVLYTAHKMWVEPLPGGY